MLPSMQNKILVVTGARYKVPPPKPGRLSVLVRVPHVDGGILQMQKFGHRNVNGSLLNPGVGQNIPMYASPTARNKRGCHLGSFCFIFAPICPLQQIQKLDCTET